MKHTVTHGLGKDKAKEVAQKAFASYQERYEKYHPKANWVRDDKAEISFSVKGMSLKGSLEVDERDIAMELDVPFVLRPFKGKALGVIEEEIQKWIVKAKNGEL
ncbi:MAG: polyhydroxyalkanoic acid system family protein [Polyangiaceae bacterium]|nr:polyhydroxyalkanoic acid system family protein [Polyangiaceae bacterium]